MNIKTVFQRFQKKHPRFTTRAPRLKYVYGWHYKHSRIVENQILFESFHGKDISDSPFYILRSLIDSGKASQYRIYFSTNGSPEHADTVHALGLPVKLVNVTSYEYVRILATSHYLINNSSFPVYFIRKPEQIYLQTWHGTPLKTLGKSMRYGIESMYSIQHNFLHASYLLFPNRFTEEVILRDYNMLHLFTGKSVISGYPRNSIFFDSEKGKMTARQLGHAGFTTFAYMPTWRGQSSMNVETDSFCKNIFCFLDELDVTLSDRQRLFVNFHPIIQSALEPGKYKHIFPFPADVDKYEFLNSMDVLITDYSSVLFDFSITRKPIILFMYDLEEYHHDRGLYLSISRLPFIKLYDLDALKHCLVTESFKDYDYSTETDYLQEFISCDSPDSPEKMLDLVLNGTERGLEITDYSCNRRQKRRLLIFPEILDNSDLDAAAACANSRKDIIAFYRKQFNPSLSSYYYDHYKDCFDCIFITSSQARTFMEEAARHFSTKVQERLSGRELFRCLPCLEIEQLQVIDGKTLRKGKKAVTVQSD